MAATTRPPSYYFFYDTETTDLDHTGQICQYAGILTDENLDIVDKFERYCLPRQDVIPAVGAFLTHKIPLSKIIEEGVFEPEFFRNVYEDMTLNGNTCVTGYNSLKFDDNRVREGFYRVNVDPYEREWMAENSRFDIYKMMKAVYALKPDLIEWPIKEDGRVSMKLEHIAPLNDVVQERAHDAMSDVEATIGVMKIIKDKDSKFFDYCMKLRNKAFVGNMIENKPFLLVGESMSMDRNFAGVVVPITNHPSNKNSKICLDVGRMDDETIDKILSTPPEDIEHMIFRADREERFPLVEVKINQLPFVFTPALLKDEKLQERLGIDFNETKEKIDSIQKDPRRSDLIKHLYQAYNKPIPTSEDVYGKIYASFMPRWDKNKLENFSINDYSNWEKVADGFSDNRIKELTTRTIGNIDPKLLSEEGKQSFNDWMVKRYNDETGDLGMTLPEFWYDVKMALENPELSDEDKDMIRELDEHVNYYAEKYAPNLVANKEMKVQEVQAKKEQEALEAEVNSPVLESDEKKQKKQTSGPTMP